MTKAHTFASVLTAGASLIPRNRTRIFRQNLLASLTWSHKKIMTMSLMGLRMVPMISGRMQSTDLYVVIGRSSCACGVSEYHGHVFIHEQRLKKTKPPSKLSSII